MSEPSSVYIIRVSLKDSKPPIWRKLAVWADTPLDRLHEIIQIAMGWTDSHLHQFILRPTKPAPLPKRPVETEEPFERKVIEFGDGRKGCAFIPNPNYTPKPNPEMDAYYAAMRSNRGRFFASRKDPFGEPLNSFDINPEDEDEAAFTLAELCPAVKSKLIYEYDFGDDWEHVIEVKEIIDPEPEATYPVCLGGKKACPPEDCGGMWGYYSLLEALGDPKHPEHKDLLDWLGGPIDPEAFDVQEVNDQLDSL